MNSSYSTQFIQSSYPLLNQVKLAHAMPKQQQGAVLMISLILLLVMTVLGLSTMNTSVMQEKMAANSQNVNKTFQAAESAITSVTNQVLGGVQTRLANAMGSTTVPAVAVAYATPDAAISASSQVQYLGEIILTSGSSLNADESSTILKGHRFELSGIVNMNSVNTQKIIRQGIEYR